MIIVKDKGMIEKMECAGQVLAELFSFLAGYVQPGASTLELDSWIEQEMQKRELLSQSKGYMGYKHVSCISLNDEVVHGIPSATCLLKDGDLVKIDICAAYKGYCADMARMFVVGKTDESVVRFMKVARQALDKGVAEAKAGNRLSDISAAVQHEVERHGFGIVRDFAGHGIGCSMHEDPEVPNYGLPGKGPVLKSGMTFAIEPMITMGHYDIYVADDGWTVRTVDKSLAAHVEDTIAVTDGAPLVLTRMSQESGQC